jgi:hypothetical protein
VRKGKRQLVMDKQVMESRAHRSWTMSQVKSKNTTPSGERRMRWGYGSVCTVRICRASRISSSRSGGWPCS